MALIKRDKQEFNMAITNVKFFVIKFSIKLKYKISRNIIITNKTMISL